jgi:hypothetical protein
LQSIYPIQTLLFCHPVSNATPTVVAVVVIIVIVVVVVVVVVVIIVVVEDRHGLAGIL